MSAAYLVVGFGVSGEAVSRALRDRGESVVAVDDHPTGNARQRAVALDVVLHEAPSPDELASLVAAADAVVPSPGVPLHHPVFALARAAGTAVQGEVELASTWTRRPLVAVTGTNGKTTVTTLVRDMLVASGARAVAAGNIGLPLVEAIDADVDVIVVEVSSFQLAATETFRPRVAVWLNVAEDHLEAHGTFDHYVAAKARVWANQRDDDLAVANAEDPRVLAEATRAPAQVTTFGVHAGDWRLRGGALCTPDGRPVVEAGRLARALPHDVANALAAAAAAYGAGATVGGIGAALGDFRGLPHRLTLVGEAGGVRWYDDSKATNPHAALAAVESFASVVLLAGGRNKGLDLSVLARASDRLRGVVAFGEATPEVERAFASVDGVAVRTADTMADAVAAAAGLARPGDVVLLSPACASFDSYRSYAERGDDFASEVRRRIEAA